MNCHKHGSTHAPLSYCPMCAQENSYQQGTRTTQLEQAMGQINPNIAAEMRNLSSILSQLRFDLNRRSAELEALKLAVAKVAEQAEDEGLWFVATTAPEAYLQQELRKLHRIIEGEG